jgi:hypothetical protein
MEVELPNEFARPTEHELRMEQARARSLWELGDPSWADVIVGAYLCPAQDRAALAREQDDTGLSSAT